MSFLAQAAIFALCFFCGKSLYLWSSQAVVRACPPSANGHHGPHGHQHGFHHPSPMVADLPIAMMPGSLNASSPHPHPPQLSSGQYTACFGQELQSSATRHTLHILLGQIIICHPSLSLGCAILPLTKCTVVADSPSGLCFADCQQAIMTMNGLFALTVLLALIGVVYAARRRTQMRETFGIAGTHMSDFCSWLWCPVCSLCQETRTLWSNNVHEGVWYGPTQLVATDPVMEAPTVKQMQTDDFVKPVIAKDFV